MFKFQSPRLNGPRRPRRKAAPIALVVVILSAAQVFAQKPQVV